MLTIEKARQFIEKYPDHDAFVKLKHEESVGRGEGDNSIQMSQLWAACKDLIWQTDNYNPVGCNHEKANGFSAWHWYSHGTGHGTEGNSEQTLSICEKCGDIKLSGHENLKHYEYIFSIHWLDALRPIIKQAEFIYGEKLFTEISETKIGDTEEVGEGED